MDIFQKITEGTVTADDFNRLISESLPSSTRERSHRTMRVAQTANTNAQDIEGHAPKIRPAARSAHQKAGDNDPMQTARGKAAHRKSQRTQARTHMEAAVAFLKANHSKPVIECDLSKIDRDFMLKLIAALPEDEWRTDLAAALR